MLKGSLVAEGNVSSRLGDPSDLGVHSHQSEEKPLKSPSCLNALPLIISWVSPLHSAVTATGNSLQPLNTDLPF